jgi:Ca2+/Na+ antiporter
MGYFDALTSSAFKTGKDGGRLFFPWGVLGRGYVLASERDYERLQRQIKAYMIVTLVLIVGTVMLQAYLWSVIAVALLIAVYVIWVMYLLRGLQPSDERLSLEESMTSQAVRHNATVLWLMQIGSLIFVAAGILMLVLEPGNWLIALASTVFFGLCAAVFARMLFLRSRQVPR